MIKLLSPDERAQRWLAILLALIAGYVDSYALFAYSVFVSFMSGNTTSTGYMIGRGKLGAAVATGLAILFFAVGSILGMWVAKSKLRNARQVLFGSIAVVLAIIISGTQSLRLVLPADACISILAVAMGLVNATHSRVGAEAVSLTFVTGALNKVGTHLALALHRVPLPDAQGTGDTHLRRAGIEASIWAGFVVGAMVSGAASVRFGVWALLAPLLGMLTLAVLSSTDRIGPMNSEEKLWAKSTQKPTTPV